MRDWSANWTTAASVMALRLLAVAAACGRVATVFFIGIRLKAWHISDRALQVRSHFALCAMQNAG